MKIEKRLCQLKLIIQEILPKPKRKTTLNNSDLESDDHQTNSIGNEYKICFVINLSN